MEMEATKKEQPLLVVPGTWKRRAWRKERAYDYSQLVVPAAKRAYEYSQGERDVTIEKLYKCNYWEDPAYDADLQCYGLRLARSAAIDNFMDRLDREYEAYMAGGSLKEDPEDL